MNRRQRDINTLKSGYYIIFYCILSVLFLYLFHLRITQMQQQKENLTVQVNDTVATQLDLEEEVTGLKLALGNITSSLHQLALTDATPSPQPNQTHPTNHTTEVSLDTFEVKLELVTISTNHLVQLMLEW